MSMDLDNDLANSAMKMKRAARFNEDREAGMVKRKKPLNLLSSLNDKLINGDDWEENATIDWEKNFT